MFFFSFLCAEVEISKYISDYLTSKFSGYTNRTLVDYLQIRFNTTDPAMLANATFQEILRPLNEKATPLFWLSSAFPLGNASPLGYCSVPDSAGAILTAAERLKEQSPELNQVKGKLTDRIFLLRCTVGVPLFAYNGVPSCAQKYHSDREKGKHLYEFTERDARDWREFSDLQPYSTIAAPEDDLKKAAADYEKAVASGIIRNTQGTDYAIMLMPDCSSVLEACEAAVNDGDANKIQAQHDALVAFMKSGERKVGPAVPNDGAPGHEEKVRRDHILGSIELRKLIATELENYKKLEDEEVKLKNMIGRRDFEKIFLDAVWTGVIAFNNPIISYTKEVFGMTDEITLSDPRTEPYGKYVPLYQAFVTFCNMSADDQKEISEKADDRIMSISPEMKEAADKLTKLFTKEYLGLMQRQAQRTDKPAEIIQFLLRFMTGFTDFKLMYAL